MQPTGSSKLVVFTRSSQPEEKSSPTELLWNILYPNQSDFELIRPSPGVGEVEVAEEGVEHGGREAAHARLVESWVYPPTFCKTHNSAWALIRSDLVKYKTPNFQGPTGDTHMDGQTH